MGIVKMKRISMVGPQDVVQSLLATLQDVALLDPVAMTDQEEPPGDLAAKKGNIQRVKTALETRRRELKKSAPAMNTARNVEAATKTIENMETLLAGRAEMENRLAVLLKEKEQLEPWGNFDPADLTELGDNGVYLQLLIGSADEIQAVDLAGAAWSRQIPLDARGRQMGLAILTLDTPVQTELDEANLPAKTMEALKAEVSDTEASLDRMKAEIGSLSSNLPSIARYDDHIADGIRFAEVQAGLGGDEELFTLTGWCPATKVNVVQTATAKLPVALLIEDPTDDDEVPIELNNGPLVRQFEPLLKAFSLPNYKEFDPTMLIAPFMGLFFGFCLGDLGYGVILTLLATFGLLKFKPQGVARLAVQWLLILGLCTVVIGGLTGNLFGVKIFEAFNLPPNMLLFVLNDNVVVFFWTAMGLGVVQLMVGMFVKLIRQIRKGEGQRVIATLGWLSVLPIFIPVLAPTLWGTEEMLPSWTMLIPVGLILLFESPSPSMVRRLGGGAWGVYNIIGLFGDVMSYIRIFGLGLSSAIIAMVVNTIAMGLAEDGSIIGWMIAIVVLVVGHLFNFVMAMIGSVVHPARLQFLEYFGKFFEGGGRAYSPFQKVEGR